MVARTIHDEQSHDDFLAAELVASAIAQAREKLAAARGEILDAPPPSTPDLRNPSVNDVRSTN